MTAIAVAFAATLLVGPAVGLLAAVLGWVKEVRPRQFLRKRSSLLSKAAALFAAAGFVLVGIGIAQADRLQAPLAPTCAAAALLLAIATWLLSVEPDDGGEEAETLDEPKWWPDFERDLADWTETTRLPAGPRSSA